MSGEDKSLIYKTLSQCTALLNGQVQTGQANMYVTIDRVRYNELLQAIAEAKRILIRRDTSEFYDG